MYSSLILFINYFVSPFVGLPSMYQTFVPSASLNRRTVFPVQFVVFVPMFRTVCPVNRRAVFAVQFVVLVPMFCTFCILNRRTVFPVKFDCFCTKASYRLHPQPPDRLPGDVRRLCTNISYLEYSIAGPLPGAVCRP
jgi:hypothetical protein